MDVLVLSAHADDETLGCGGTLLDHRDRGDQIHWLILTSPIGPRWSPEIVAAKARQVDAVAAAYGMEEVVQLQLPSGGLDMVPVTELMTGISAVVRRTAPTVVYLVHPGDIHTDHVAGFAAAMSVLKPFHMRALGVSRILAYETLSSTEAAATTTFAPNVFRDITATIDRKLEVMSLYETELQPEPFPRSDSAIRALARFRGAAIAVKFAEAFALVREIG